MRLRAYQLGFRPWAESRNAASVSQGPCRDAGLRAGDEATLCRVRSSPVVGSPAASPSGSGGGEASIGAAEAGRVARQKAVEAGDDLGESQKTLFDAQIQRIMDEPPPSGGGGGELVTAGRPGRDADQVRAHNNWMRVATEYAEGRGLKYERDFGDVAKATLDEVDTAVSAQRLAEEAVARANRNALSPCWTTLRRRPRFRNCRPRER